MITVNVHEAKTNLSRLLVQVCSGEEVTIAKAGKPVARLVPVTARKEPRVLGLDRGLFTVPDDFDDPLSEEELAEFES